MIRFSINDPREGLSQEIEIVLWKYNLLKLINDYLVCISDWATGPEPSCWTGNQQEVQRSGRQDTMSRTCQNCTLATRFEVKGWTRVRGRTEGGDTVPEKNLKLRGDLVAAAAIAQLRRLWAGVDTGRPLEQTINRYAEPGHPGWAKNTKGNKYKHKNDIPRQLDHNWKRSGPTRRDHLASMSHL